MFWRQVILVLVLSIGLAHTCGFFDNSVYDENLTDWVVEGGSDAEWEFSGSSVNNTGKQTINTALPTYLVTDRLTYTSLKGKIRVTDTGDDDFIGLVFASGTNAVFLSWKKANQGICDSTASIGTALSYTTSYGTNSTSLDCDYWLHTGTVTELARGSRFSDSGWSANTFYRFNALFTDTHITIYINDQVEFDYDISAFPFGTSFPMDKIGFFGFSQKDVEYSEIQVFSITGVVGCEDASYRSYFDPDGCSSSSYTADVTYGDGQTESGLSPTIPSTGLPYFDLSHSYLSSGSFAITIELFDGVSSTPVDMDLVSVFVDPALTASISLTPDSNADCGFSLRCGVGSATLNILSITGGNSPYSASWNDQGTTFNYPSSGSSRSINTPGTYYLDVYDSGTCTFTTTSVTATQSSFSNMDVSLGSQCGTITASATGTANCQSFQYFWNDLGTFGAATRTNLGPGTYTASARDVNQCTSSQDSVTIVDQPPTASCRSTLELDVGVTGSVSVTTSSLDNGSSDPCGMLSLSLDNNYFTGGNCASVGSHTSGMIASGYPKFSPSSCTTAVQVVDNVDPVARCRDFRTNFPGGSYTLNIANIDAGSSDICGVSLSASQTVFNNFGEYFVTLTATDPSGNTDTCVSKVELIGFNIVSPVQAESKFMYVPFTVSVAYYLPNDSTMTVRVVDTSDNSIYEQFTGSALSSEMEVVFYKTLPGAYEIQAVSDQTSVTSLNAPRIRLCVTPYADCSYSLF